MYFTKRCRIDSKALRCYNYNITNVAFATISLIANVINATLKDKMYRSSQIVFKSKVIKMRSNQRITLTKRLLHEVLLRIMERKPLDKINVSELCQEAGINRATFYRHYNVPRDVLVDMQAQFAERLKSSLDINTLINSPHQYIEQVCSYLYKHSDLIKIFIRNNSEEDITCLFDDFFQKLLRKNNDMYKKRQLDDAEMKLLSAYMAGGGYFMLRRWLLDDIEKTPKEITELVLSF